MPQSQSQTQGQTYSEAQPAPRRKAAPWIAFILGVALTLAAVAAWFLIFHENPAVIETAPITVEAPKLPDIKMPDQPILPRG